MLKLRNRSTAWLITLVVVLLAVYLGAGRTLRSMHDNVTTIYYESRGIYETLEDVSANSLNLVTVAERYVEEGNFATTDVQKAVTVLEDSYGAADQYRAAQELQKAVQDLNGLLDTLPVSETDKSYQAKLTTNIDTYLSVLDNNKYNEEAARFNKAIRRYPARVLAPIVGIRPIELFE